METIYHEGEQKIQELAGESVQATSNSRVIGNSIIPGAINFIEKQTMVVVSSTDDSGKVWTSVLLGGYGLLKVPDPAQIIFHIDKLLSTDQDIFFSNIKSNSNVGALFIELSTRRRYRVNGTASLVGDQVQFDILEAYPNCPQYIQRRNQANPESLKKPEATVTSGETLNTDLIEWINHSDTLFVGSQGPNGRMDASHRGGNAGFVEVLNDGSLKVPDYRGNSMFNTLGNLSLNPNVGVVFIDFDNHRSLQVSGKATLIFDQKSDEDMEKTTGTGRYWVLSPEQWVVIDQHHLSEWEFVDYSPFNP